MGSTVTIDLVSAGIYAALVVGGYFLRHLNILGGGSPPAPTPAPTPTPQPQEGTGHPVLDRVVPVLEELFAEFLKQKLGPPAKS